MFHVSAGAGVRIEAAVRATRAVAGGQTNLGILLLLAGYASLAVSADTASEWLLLRVVGGFVLLFVGFTVAIGPTVAALLGDHD